MGRARALVQHRRILAELVRRDIKVKYSRSVLGYVWSLLEPLLLTAVYFFVFSIIGRFGIEDYPLFLIAALLPWLWFSSTVTASSKSLTSQARLITKVYLPREILPLAAVGAKGFEYLASLPVLAFFAIIMGVPPTKWLALLPLAMLLQLILLVGIALAVSSLNAMMRDVERLIRIGLRALFYGSPIIYSLDIALDRLDPWADWLYRANPLVGVFELSRAVWFSDQFPGWDQVGITAVGCVLVLAVGWGIFARLERAVLKEL